MDSRSGPAVDGLRRHRPCLAWPFDSIVVLVLVAGVWLVVLGVVQIIQAPLHDSLYRRACRMSRNDADAEVMSDSKPARTVTVILGPTRWRCNPRRARCSSRSRLTNWAKPALGPAVIRTASHRVSPDTERLGEFAQRINGAQRPTLVFGPEIDRSGAWDAAVAFAEKVGAPVYGGALPDRASFPEDHRLYQGQLPMTVAGVTERLRGYDLVAVIGAQVFRYYPYVAGEYLPEGTELLQITNDPHLAATAPVGDSLVGDVLLALEQLVGMVDDHSDRQVPAADAPTGTVDLTGSAPLAPDAVWSTLSTVKPADSPLVTESTSTLAQQVRFLPTTRPSSFFATASGGIGWGVPGAVGIALRDRARGIKRTVVATIGDGSFQYSVQAIWTAARTVADCVRVGRYGDTPRSSSCSLGTGEDTRSAGAGPTWPRYRLPGGGFRMSRGQSRHHREACSGIQHRAGGRRTHRHCGAD